MDNMLAVQGLGAKKTEREGFRKDSAESFKRIRYSDLAHGAVGTFLQIASQFLEWGFSVYVVAWVIFVNHPIRADSSLLVSIEIPMGGGNVPI